MAPTTLSGQRSTTTPRGRGRMEGLPLKVSELIAALDGPVYVERTALFDQKNRKRTQKAITKALRLQMENRGFAFVEILSECPTHWGLSPLEAEAWVRDQFVQAYPLGVLKDVEVEPWFRPQKPDFSADRMLEVLAAAGEAPQRFADGFPEHLDPRDVSLKLAGAGGDGAQTAALLLAKAAVNEGFDATHIPSYGPESRGGTSYADVHIAREEVLSPAAPVPRVLAAFNAPSLIKFGPTVAEDGIAIYDSSVISETPGFRRGVKVYPVPCSEIAQSLGQRIVKNVVALGALQAASRILPEESLLTAIRQSLHDKCSMIPLNEEAFRWGVKAVREKISSFAPA